MFFRPLLAAAALVLPLTAMAESPNIVPGQWQFTSTTSVKGDVPIPDQTDSHQECIAQGDIDDADFQFLEVEEGCELLEHNVSADGVDYKMICRAEGGEANIDGRMDFLGERVEGSVNIDTESPVGQMQLQTTIEGERLGDC
ncbi:MAG: DUF3617 domain-containing protein [Halomonas sp.]|uniref:DUF3617 domain-containing protein n=2 Tax=Halomonadaceae TaxID=28256 RepID=A0ABS6ZTF3_9GAMM|nr:MULTISPECIES: DUF3617 family protein [Halomonas]MBW6392300.1 DUF3617 domain-containing protein [Halomonas antri]MDX5376912.1 DUF3617 domain-containing protein [Halomonas sp.]MDX5502516.1 DUF3617 domain-containing protein [Halomonas sp.]QTP58598.1 DUF3617 family protein [Halomonas sulfidivorans]